MKYLQDLTIYRKVKDSNITSLSHELRQFAEAVHSEFWRNGSIDVDHLTREIKQFAKLVEEL